MNMSSLTRHVDPSPAFDRPANDGSADAPGPRATAHVIALAELPPTPGGTGDPVVTDLGSPLLQVMTTLQVSVGEVRVSLGELLEARAEHVFVLDRAVDQVVDILLEGRVVARGQLVAVDDQFAVRLTELPLPLHP